MCGILGSVPATESHLFEAALSTLSHRGPDGKGILDLNGKVSLGHTRLAVIDVSPVASQPLRYQHLAIVLNGEIYNYPELKNELKTAGYTFTTQSDTEVVAAAYLKWGHSCLNRFNGMWALAVWDDQQQELFLSRDRFGKKPLFYTFTQGRFVFASEMKALVPFMPAVEVSNDFRSMAAHVLDYEATGKCLLKGITRFPAGHYAYYRQGKLKMERYWNTYDHLPEVPASYEAQAERFEMLFRDACSIRLRADVPLGTSLSGGLDSGAITSMVNHLSKNNKGLKSYEAFTAFMPGTSSDESPYAVSLCKQLDIPLNLVKIDAVKAAETVFEDFYYFEELYHTPPFPMTETYRAFREKGVKVSLDGHGADELFSGYRNFMFLAFVDSGFDIKTIKEISRTYNDTFSYDQAQHYDKRKPVEAYLKTRLWYFLKSNELLPAGISKEQRRDMIERMGHLNYGLYVLFHYTILPTLLRNYDRYAMRYGVEVRMPFMDHRLVSYCLALPWHSKIKGGFTKAIVRDALSAYVPDNIRLRKAKMGYQAPLNNWFGSAWREFLQDSVLAQDFKNCNLINPTQITKDLESLLKKPLIDYIPAEKLFADICPYFWEKGFLKKATLLHHTWTEQR
ncbi:MAG: Asparagine synthetase (glutamine-hydrolyzing) 3 [Bacteroidetes bacterium ADurb.Bin408]|nr:MAG: Asparagine synthetase (glutamine-hydrolyzing) 3 [Bacteroidetes bacterium ADurb.Bin408]